MKAKKVISVLAAATLVASSTAALVGCTPRGDVLRIYNWGDYMDESLADKFEDWYHTETGKNVKVEYSTFDTNEDMITRIEVRHDDYDLVCPSDYMAERMIKAGLAQKVNTEIFDIHQEGLFYDGLAEMVAPFDNDNEYFVPYIWGTFGIMYDTTKIEAGSEAMKSWSAMWSSDYNKRILMKDSVRDAYSIARLYSSRDTLAAQTDNFTNYDNAQYRSTLNDIFSTIDRAAIDSAKQALLAQRGVVLDYEVDDGKNDMLSGSSQASLGFFWSCDSGLIMQDNSPRSKLFYYEVPKEGSNVWVDGWIIPKYAANPAAANYFLKFINTHEFARINYDYLGNTLAVKSVMDEVKAELEADEDGFFSGAADWFKPMYIDMMFPTEQVLARCGVMRDFGTEWNTALDSMWVDVRTN